MIKPVLLIDGNNLAHFLYTNLVPGKKMTSRDSLRLIVHLSSYTLTYGDAVEIELCLDRPSRHIPPLPVGLRVFCAESPQNGDDLLLSRFSFHRYNRQPCLVITNDEDVLQTVARMSGLTMKVSDFVRRPGIKNPVFRDPQDLPDILLFQEEPITVGLGEPEYIRLVTRDRKPAARIRTVKINRNPQKPSGTRNEAGSQTIDGETEVISSTAPDPYLKKTAGIPDRRNDPESALVEKNNHLQMMVVDAKYKGPFYGIDLDRWPVQEGVRFLLNAFCPIHQDEYRQLMQTFDREALRTEDLHALAEMLMKTCGQEPDFARRGSLMNRVRLALLLAQGETLSLDELAQSTGYKLLGLQGRIKEKAGNWVVILHE